ncbi:MAG TPA: adenylate/guanylate cyclase domain-containing protein, partial [Gaiellaceae bacterium]|nr:adenylate/guanylate cyclase domain-containing protein [Gaiellaceae bacterium]
MDGPPGDADSTFCACGRPIPTGARFCPSCGAALDAPAAIPEERKVVSVLFADLVGFTRRAEQLDPEEVGSLLEPYWRHLRQELERHSGTVEKFVGDAVVALFGAPVAHEDDPERAVRAALAIRDWARRRTGSDVRIGVTTGEVLVRLLARPEAGDVLAVGDVVNTCRRLQEAAPVNGILVDGATREATRDAIEYDDAGTVAAKGKAKPVRAWRAVRARARAVRHPAPTRFVGRATELALLRGLFDRVVEERSPQL